MRKKFIRTMAVTITASMMAASFAGCGTEAKATDQEVPMEEETIIATDDEPLDDVDATAEDDTAGTEEEVAGGEETKDETDSEDSDIVFYDEIGKYPDYLLSEVAYEPMEEKAVTAVDDIDVYSEEGFKVGCVKSGATVTLTEHGINSTWYRFENPVAGTDYNYLCMLDDDIPINESELLKADEVKGWIIERISNRNFDPPKYLDTPDSDMEYVEFSIDRQKEYPDAGWIIDQVLFSHGFDVGDFASSDYVTFCVECTENEMDIECKVYYKDYRG